MACSCSLFPFLAVINSDSCLCMVFEELLQIVIYDFLPFKSKKDMKNWLDDKTVLRNILKQGDLANTIHGGTSQTFVSINKKNNQMEILVSASGVHSSDFRVTLNNNKLILTRYLNERHNGVSDERFNVPAFLKQFDLPLTVERDKIKAYYEDGLLRIIVPMKDERDLNKEIEIQGF